MSNENIEMTNALLNAGWNDIEDLPSYVDFPTGSYHVRCSKAEVKEPNPKDEKPDVAVRVHVELVAVLESTAESEKLPKVGDKAMFSFKGAEGIKRMKAALMQVATAINAASPSELVDRLEGLEFAITVQQSPNANNPDRPYTNLRTAVML